MHYRLLICTNTRDVLRSDNTCLQAYQTYKLGGKISELLYSPAAFGIDLSSKDMPKPSEPSTAEIATALTDTAYLPLPRIPLLKHCSIKCSILAQHPSNPAFLIVTSSLCQGSHMCSGLLETILVDAQGHAQTQ